MACDKKIFWDLVKKEMSCDFVHGLPHIERVYKFFEILKSESKLPQKVLEALEIAVICHDIGRSKNKTRSHAKVSAEKFLKEIKKAGIKTCPTKLIEFAIARHNRGLKAKWKNHRQAVLGLLTYLDHLDALGSIGIARVFLFCKIPVYPTKFFQSKAVLMLKNPKTITSRHINMKNKNILEHLIYNYCITWNLRRKVAGLIPNKLKKVEKEKLDAMKYFILNMIKIFDN